jgi:hypothetical protein
MRPDRPVEGTRRGGARSFALHAAVPPSHAPHAER